jgi:hypothetical protein
MVRVINGLLCMLEVYQKSVPLHHGSSSTPISGFVYSSLVERGNVWRCRSTHAYAHGQEWECDHGPDGCVYAYNELRR